VVSCRSPHSSLRAHLDRCASLGDHGQTLLASRQLLGDRHPIRHVRLIGCLGLRHEFSDLGLQLGLDLACMLIR
jgi:hypothetical protein